MSVKRFTDERYVVWIDAVGKRGPADGKTIEVAVVGRDKNRCGGETQIGEAERRPGNEQEW